MEWKIVYGTNHIHFQLPEIENVYISYILDDIYVEIGILFGNQFNL